MNYNTMPKGIPGFWNYCGIFFLLFFLTSIAVAISFGIVVYRRRQKGLNVWGDVRRPPLPEENPPHEDRSEV